MEDRSINLPDLTAEMVGNVLCLEAVFGSARDAVVRQWLQQGKQESNAHSWFLNCDFDDGGAWSGLQDLLSNIVSTIEPQAHALLKKHSYELCLTSPELQHTLTLEYAALTDLAQGEEHVRSYPMDRAYRSIHGVIEFLDAWYQLQGRGPVVIACNNYERASSLVQLFFQELMRRRGQVIQLTLLLIVPPGQAAVYLEPFTPPTRVYPLSLDLPPNTEDSVSLGKVQQEAQALEYAIEQDPILAESAVPRLITLWKRCGNMDQALHWQIIAIQHLNHMGLYQAALHYSKEVEAQLPQVRTLFPEAYAFAATSVYFCYLSCGYVERAYHVMMENIINCVDTQPSLSQSHYLLSMLYARFFPQRDLLKAVEHLERGQALLKTAGLPEDVYFFQHVFLNNGLAYVRAQQKRPEEAIALCLDGLELLNQQLKPDEHRLHRSVLMYNIAQVYAATHQYTEALNTLTATLQLDPNYSEYYNERGTLYFKMNQFSAAEQDYLRAIQLSPPYAEVWINLGQCYREMQRFEEAVNAYTYALDLSPHVLLALVGRAEVSLELGQITSALADYNAALKVNPKQPDVLAARAVAYYENSQLEEAIQDLDAAIILNPHDAVFYQNRATALIEVHANDDAMRDLQMYLQLQPDAEDRTEVEQQMLLLPAQN